MRDQRQVRCCWPADEGPLERSKHTSNTNPKLIRRLPAESQSSIAELDLSQPSGSLPLHQETGHATSPLHCPRPLCSWLASKRTVMARSTHISISPLADAPRGTEIRDSNLDGARPEDTGNLSARCKPRSLQLARRLLASVRNLEAVQRGLSPPPPSSHRRSQTSSTTATASTHSLCLCLVLYLARFLFYPAPGTFFLSLGIPRARRSCLTN